MSQTGYILKLFEAAYMQRWNDKLRPMDFYELDKQAHKMMIAYFISSFEKDPVNLFTDVIKAGLFEFLQRIVTTDIKPPVFHMIRKDREKYTRLNLFVLEEIGPVLDLFGQNTRDDFIAYFEEGNNSLVKSILLAAHTYSSKWEFDVIKSSNPDSYDNEIIENDLKSAYEKHSGLKGICEIEGNNRYRQFLQLCGELRYQSRWSHLHRIPKTSVLGHSLFVSLLTFFFSTLCGHCRIRLYNNCVGALFHDLPETLTRDIISPIKRGVEGLSDLIKDYEQEQMEKVIYPLLPEAISDELRVFMRYEFSNRITKDGDINIFDGKDLEDGYNLDAYDAYDGEMIKACDDTAAFIEASAAVSNGCVSREFIKAKEFIYDKYKQRGPINGIDFTLILKGIDRDI